MKRLRKITLTILLALFVLATDAAVLPGSSTVAQAATITISSKSTTLEVGKTKTLKISGTRNKVSWSSGNRSVATVSGSGTVTAKAAGTATITASIKGKKLTCKVTVVKPVKISKTSVTLDEGRTDKLTVSGTTKAVTWSSSKKSVATVSSKGTITAKAAGTATITASVSGKKLTCKVTVVKPVLISDTLLFLEKGETEKLSISGTTKTVTWTSSDKTVVTVSSKGTVTAKSAGTATITASVAGKKLTCKVTVEIPVTLNTTSLSMTAGTTAKLNLSGGASTSVWTSSQKSIARVSNDGTITAYRAGNTTITAYIDGKRLKCSVSVTNPSTVTEQGFSLNMGDLTAAVSARGVTEGVTFASSNPEVATIASNGYITTVSLGQTRITASINGKEYSYLVTVIDPTVDSYMTNAPFTAKKVSFNKLSFITPTNWIMEKEEYDGSYSSYLMQPNSNSASNAIMTIYKSDETVEYREIKKEFLSLLTKDYIQEQFEAVKDELGITYKLSKFSQDDYQADFGRAFKTEYTVTINRELLKQTIYIFSIDKYIIQITVTDGGDDNKFISDLEYMLNSFTLN